MGSRLALVVFTTWSAPYFRSHSLDLILEICKVFPLYLYLCVCVCNQDFPGSKQRRTDSPIDPQTLHSPPSQQVPCPPIPIIQLLFFFMYLYALFLIFGCISTKALPIPVIPFCLYFSNICIPLVYLN